MFLHLFRILLGKNPADSNVKCPSCKYKAVFRQFATWEKNGERGLRGKLPSGHIVVACPQCHTELKYDSLSGKIERL